MMDQNRIDVRTTTPMKSVRGKQVIKIPFTCPTRKPGRPKLSEPISRYPLKLPTCLYEDVQRRAEENGFTMAGFVRRLLAGLIDINGNSIERPVDWDSDMRGKERQR